MLGAFLSCLLLLPQQPNDPVAAAEQAVAAAVAAHGDGSLEHAEQLQKLVLTLQAAQRVRDALPLAERVFAIRSEKLPPTHPRLAIAASNVATCRMSVGDYREATTLLEQARAIFAARPPTTGTIGVLNNLGFCLSQTGRLADARAALEQAVALGEKHLPDHPYTALALRSLAGVRVLWGDVQDARRLVDRALALFERIEPGSPRHRETLAGIVEVLIGADRLEEAKTLQERLLALLTPQTPAGDRAAALLRLARIEYQLKDKDAARERAKAAMALLPADEPARRRAWAHSTYAQLLLHENQPAEARRHLESALAITPPDSPTGIALVPVLARLEIRAGQAKAGVARLRAAFPDVERLAADSEYLIEARLALAEGLVATGQQPEAIATLRANLRELPRHLDRSIPGLMESARMASVARRRESLNQLLTITNAHPQSLDAAAQHDEVLLWKGQLARATRRQLDALHDDPETAAQLRRLGQIRSLIAAGDASATHLEERQALEAVLARTLPFVDRRAELPGVRAAIAAGSAFVDWFVYDTPTARRLTAFVLRADRPTVRIDCGAWQPCKDAIDAFVLTTSRSLRPGAARLQEPTARALHDRVWAPLASALAGCTAVCISPDAALAHVPFEALPGARPGTFLLEDVALSYLQNGMELLTAAPAATGKPRLLLIGAIDYGTAAGAPAPAMDSLAMRGTPRPFLPLPGTARELEQLQTLWHGERAVLRGSDASEARIVGEIGQATFVHLATHGFAGFGDDDFAGVALAGANTPSADSDGILAVAEAELLDLRQCRLFVLSACQTGLGRPTAGESLLGLRRALHIAGAFATITSLWRIDDAATTPLMVDFYRALWRDRQSPAVALRTAQLAALARIRQQHGEGLPGLWAAFVCEGR
ncbi:MAG: CHAT domain-containing protein [Planctomycetes bacterium]|nr:CHAT domain-containing protein [Planctomycetota bacterium]